MDQTQRIGKFAGTQDDDIDDPFSDDTINIPAWMVRYRGVSMGAKVVFGRLRRYAGRKRIAYPKMPTLADEVGVSERQVRNYVEELREKGFIHTTRRFAGGCVFTFAKHHPAKDGDPGTPRIQPPIRQSTAESIRKGTAEFANTGLSEPAIRQSTAGSIRQSTAAPFGSLLPDCYKEEEEIHSRDSTSTSEAEAVDSVKTNPKDVPETNRTPEDPPIQTQEAPGEALAGPDDSAVDVVKRLYRKTPGAKVENLGTRKAQDLVAQLDRKAEDVGLETFARALAAFLKTEDDFLIEHRWPLRVFVKQFRQWVEKVEDAPPPAPRRVEPPPTQSVPAPTSHFPTRNEAPAGQFSPDDVVARWNTHVPSSQRILRWVSDWTAAAKDPLFQEHMDAIFDKVEALIQGKKLKQFVPTLGWLLKGENWAKVLNGEYEWALTEGAAAASAPAPDVGQDDDNRLYTLPPETDPLRIELKRRNVCVDWITAHAGGDEDTQSANRRRLYEAFDGIGASEEDVHVLRSVLDELRHKPIEEQWAIIERVEKQYPRKESK